MPQQNIQVQNQGTPGAVHNITQYIETVLIPGGPVTSLNAVLTAANQGQLDQVAAAFNTAVAHNYTNQLIDVVKEVGSNILVIKVAHDPVARLCEACQGLHQPTHTEEYGTVACDVLSKATLALQHRCRVLESMAVPPSVGMIQKCVLSDIQRLQYCHQC